MQRRIIILALVNLILFPDAAMAASAEAASLDDAVRTVKEMIAQGKPRGEIAAWVTRTVDERILALNRNEADERSGMHDAAYDMARESFDAWSDAGVGVDDPYASAHWTWENRVGHCQENAHMAYHILMMAGESGAGLGELACGDHVYVVWGMPKDFAGKITIDAINSWKDAFLIDPWLGVCKPAAEVGRLDFTMTKAGFQEINRVATWSYANYLKKYRLWLSQCEDLAGSYGLETDKLVVTSVSGSGNIALGQAQFMKPAGCFQVAAIGPCRVRLTFRASVLEGSANGRLAVLNRAVQGNTQSASIALIKVAGRPCLKVVLRSTAGGANITREGILRKI